MFGAVLTGGKVGSEEILFSVKRGFHSTQREFLADTQTAGSIGLLLQVSLPCLVFAPEAVVLKLRGGTNAIAAPQVDYTTMVFKPIAERFGIKFDFEIVKRGFYPKGGGLVEVKVQPAQHLTPVTMTDRGKVVSVYSLAFVSGVISKDVIAGLFLTSRLLRGCPRLQRRRLRSTLATRRCS
jgi:RNA 3'-terminal phosphate cyclase (ATP)